MPPKNKRRKSIYIFGLIIFATSTSALVNVDDIKWHSPCGSYVWNNFGSKKWFGISEEEMTWQEAQEFCDTFGDGLATFKNDVENDALHNAWGKLKMTCLWRRYFIYFVLLLP